MAISREEVEGREFDWFAIDGAGHLALCSTAGWGEIPEVVLQQCTAADSPMDYIDGLIAMLPEIGNHQPEGRGPGSCREWQLLGDRGLYVYDWRHWSGPYERIIRPALPVEAPAVPSDLLAQLRPVTLSQLEFSCCQSFPGTALG